MLNTSAKSLNSSQKTGKCYDTDPYVRVDDFQNSKHVNFSLFSLDAKVSSRVVDAIAGSSLLHNIMLDCK